MKIHSPTITGSFVGNISVSSTSTSSFGHIIKAGVNWETAVSSSAAVGGFGSGGGSGFDYTSGSSPVVTTNPSSLGATWINTTSGELFVCHDISTGANNWLGTAGTSVAPPPYFGSRGLFMGGYGQSNVIDYITIASTGNASDFGNLTVARSGYCACSDGTKGVFGGGNGDPTIDYITIATTGNATDFGDLTANREAPSSCSG